MRVPMFQRSGRPRTAFNLERFDKWLARRERDKEGSAERKAEIENFRRKCAQFEDATEHLRIWG